VRKVTHTRKRNAWADRDELLHRCRGPRRNYLCRFVSRLVTGFGRGGGSNFGFLHRLASSPLQHSRTTVRVCDGRRIGNRTQAFKWYNFQWPTTTKSCMIYPMVPFPVTLSDPKPRFQGHGVILSCVCVFSRFYSNFSTILMVNKYVHIYAYRCSQRIVCVADARSVGDS